MSQLANPGQGQRKTRIFDGSRPNAGAFEPPAATNPAPVAVERSSNTVTDARARSSSRDFIMVMALQ